MPRTRVPLRLHVTGGTGYLGAELRRQAPHATWERVDIRDAAASDALFKRLRPEIVMHTAYLQAARARGRSPSTARRTSRARRRRSERGSSICPRTSSSTAARETPYIEDDEPAPVTDYGRAKAEAERRVSSAHPDALIVRTSLIVGGPGFPPSKHELAAHDRTMTFYDDEIR